MNSYESYDGAQLRKYSEDEIEELGFNPSNPQFKWGPFILGFGLLSLCIFILNDPKFTATHEKTFSGILAAAVSFADTIWSPMFAGFAIIFAIGLTAYAFIAFTKTFSVVLATMLMIWGVFIHQYPEIVKATFILEYAMKGKAAIILQILLTLWSEGAAYIMWALAGLLLIGGLSQEEKNELVI